MNDHKQRKLLTINRMLADKEHTLSGSKCYELFLTYFPKKKKNV